MCRGLLVLGWRMWLALGLGACLGPFPAAGALAIGSPTNGGQHPPVAHHLGHMATLSADASSWKSPVCGPNGTRIGNVLPAVTLAGMQFVSTSRAVGVTNGDVFCGTSRRQSVPISFVVSSDGGRRWVVISHIPSSAAIPGPAYLVQMAFLNRMRGWILIPGRLLATSNGGRSWRVVDLPRSAVALARRGKVVEALTVDCMLGSTSCPSGGAVRLWRYLPRRDSWIGSPAVEVSHAENAELLLNPIQDELLLDPVQDVTYLTPLGAGPPPLMLRTSDGGVHWTPLAYPCSTMSLDNMAVSPSGALWAACTGQGAGEEGPETLSVSNDRGASWRRVWSGSAYGSFPRGIAAFSATTAAMNIQLNLSVTTDGGSVWTETQAGYDPGGPSMFDILSPRDIWYFVPSGGAGRDLNGVLWFSHDGINFTKVA
jgi:hypothetical protein